jgi:hypothetical protein
MHACASCQGKLLSLTGSAREQRNRCEGVKKLKEVEKESPLASMLQKIQTANARTCAKHEMYVMFSFIRKKVLELDQAAQAEPVPENHTHHSVLLGVGSSWRWMQQCQNEV